MQTSLILPDRSVFELPVGLGEATVADWLAQPEERGAELVGGHLVYKAFPTFDHGQAQRKLGGFLTPFDCRPGDAGRPGGWWFGSEVDMLLVGQGVRPDMAGWRRDRLPKKPRESELGVITERPDWVAEILSPSNVSHDLRVKLSIYHAAGILHYWILDPMKRTVLLHRRHPEGYLAVLGGAADRMIRPEPFDTQELYVRTLFGDDDD